MKALSLFSLLLVSFSVWAQIEITPLKPGSTVFPGDVAEAKIQLLDESLVNQLRPAQIRKWGTSQQFLFMSLSALQKDASGWNIQSKIVLGPAFSPDKTYSFVVSDRTIEVRFKGWMWNPQSQQITPEYDYENVPLFSRSWLRKHPVIAFIILAFIAGLAAYGLRLWYVRKNLRSKKIAEEKKWLTTISEANSLRDLSLLWVNRDELKIIFPHAENDLRTFFDRLNMFQFRPAVSESELSELKSYRDQLLVKLREVSRGV